MKIEIISAVKVRSFIALSRQTELLFMGCCEYIIMGHRYIHIRLQGWMLAFENKGQALLSSKSSLLIEKKNQGFIDSLD